MITCYNAADLDFWAGIYSANKWFLQPFEKGKGKEDQIKKGSYTMPRYIALTEMEYLLLQNFKKMMVLGMGLLFSAVLSCFLKCL